MKNYQSDFQPQFYLALTLLTLFIGAILLVFESYLNTVQYLPVPKSGTENRYAGSLLFPLKTFTVAPDAFISGVPDQL